MLKFQKKAQHEMKACFKNTVNSLDFFGQPPFFRILKKKKFNTSLGHLLTILLLGICALYLYFQFEELLHQSKPSVVISETQPLNIPAFTLNQNNFTIAISIADSSLLAMPTWKKNFDVAFVACNRTRFFNETKQAVDVELKCRNIPLERCDINKHFPEEYQKKFFEKFILNNMLCINQTVMQEDPPQLQGYSNADTYQFMQILMMPCRNSTTYQGCNPIEEQQKDMSKGFYAIYMGDVLLKHDNPGRPYEDAITVQFTPFASSISKSIFSNFKMIQTNTDVGYVQEDIKEEYAIMQSQQKEFSGQFNQISYIEHLIFMEQRVSNYKRTYVKIQGILGNVGGLWQLATLFLSVLVGPIISTLMNLQMANRIFNFETQPTSFNDLQSINHSERNLNDIPLSKDRIVEDKNNLTKYKSEKNTDLIQNRIHLKNYLRNKKASLHIGLWDLICMNLGLQKKKKQQIDYAVEKILTKLDVVNILKKIQEIDKLKYILLNKDQLELFNYIPKPLIPQEMFSSNFEKKLDELEQKAEFQFILQEEKPDLIKVEEAFYAFMSLKQKKRMTDIDKSILELVGEDMINIFNKINKNQEEFLLNSNRYMHSNRNLIDQHQIEIFTPISITSRIEDQFSNCQIEIVNENEHNYQQNDDLDEQAAQIPPQVPIKK